MNGICVAGSIVADLYYEIDSYPAPGMLTCIQPAGGAAGGIGNLILDLAQMDPALPVRVSTLVGEDDSGQMLRDSLSRFPNIDLSNMTVKGQSSMDLVMEARDTHQRTFFYLDAASKIYDETYVDWEKIQSKIFHLEYLLLMAAMDAPDAVYGTHSARCLCEAKRRGMITSVDLVSTEVERAPRLVHPALKYCDILCINEVEAEGVTGIPVTDDASALEALLRLRALGVACWAVIHYPKKAWGIDCRTGEIFSCPCLRLPEGYIKGTTGAGDAFCAGILYGFYQDYPLEQALRFACGSAACSLSGENGTCGMRPAAQIWKEYETYA